MREYSQLEVHSAWKILSSRTDLKGVLNVTNTVIPKVVMSMIVHRNVEEVGKACPNREAPVATLRRPRLDSH